RTRLSEELGVDPTPAVQELEAAILQQDRSLLPAVTSTTVTPAAETRQRTVVARSVGRDHDLEQLAAWVAAPSGPLLISGEAGIGKTRLVADLEALAPPDVRVLVGRCHEDDYAPAFWPWLP